MSSGQSPRAWIWQVSVGVVASVIAGVMLLPINDAQRRAGSHPGTSEQITTRPPGETLVSPREAEPKPPSKPAAPHAAPSAPRANADDPRLARGSIALASVPSVLFQAERLESMGKMPDALQELQRGLASLKDSGADATAPEWQRLSAAIEALRRKMGSPESKATATFEPALDPRRLTAERAFPLDRVCEAAAFTPDGGKIIAGVEGNGVVIYDASATQELGRLTYPGQARERIVAISVSPDGTLVAGVTGKSDTYIWKLPATSSAQAIPPANNRWFVRDLSFDPESKTLARAGAWPSGSKAKVLLWNVAGGGEGPPLEGHEGWVTSTAFSPAGAYLASGSGDRTVRIWDTRTMQETRVLTAAHPVSAVAFSPSGQLVSCGCNPGAVQVWSVPSGVERSGFSGPRSEVNRVAFRPDERVLAAAGRDGKVWFWDVATGALISTLVVSDSPQITCIAFSPDSRLLVTCGRRGRVWSAPK